MDYGTRAISTGDKTSGCYHGNYCELDGNVSGWLCLPLHSCKLIATAKNFDSQYHPMHIMPNRE